MAVLNSQDLFVVYQSEVGIVSGIGTDGISYADLDNTTGEVYNQSVIDDDLLLVGEDEVATTIIGTNLRLSYKVTAGVATDISIFESGNGYNQNEIVTISGTNVRVLIKSVQGGAVTEVELYDEGSGITIQNGLLTGYPYGKHEALMALSSNDYGQTGDFINFLVDNSNVTGATTKSKFPVDFVITPNLYTVGDEVHILANRLVDGPHLPVDVKSVTGATSGGIGKYSADQLKVDVQEWASELDSDINMSVNVIDNDGTYDHGGDITFDNDTRVLTYYRPFDDDAVPTEGSVTLDSDYGFTLNTDGTFTTDSVQTQSQFNAKTTQRLDFIESNIYHKIQTDRINQDQPRLTAGTEGRDASGDTYSELATRNDLASIEAKAEAALLEMNAISDALEQSTTFEEFLANMFPTEDP